MKTGFWLGLSIWVLGWFIPSLWGLIPIAIGAFMAGFCGAGLWVERQTRKHFDREVRELWDEPTE